jgi:hypothetical protein
MPAGFGMAVAVGLSLGAGSRTAAQSEAPLQMQQLVGTWQGNVPTALGASRSGPYWAKRIGSEVVLEHLAHGRTAELNRRLAPLGHPPYFFEPLVVRGQVPAEMLYRETRYLQVTRDNRLASALGSAAWESYSAFRSEQDLLVAAFGIRTDGVSYIALLGPSGTAVSPLRQGAAGVWEPMTLISGGTAHVLYRGALFSPMRGWGLIHEQMDLETFRRTKVWSPAKRDQYLAGIPEPHYGDVAVCLDGAGGVHWTAVLWNQGDITGRIVVDDVELANVRGRGGAVDWRPQMAWVRGRGLVITLAGTNGAAVVGEVHGNQFRQLAELPSDPPGLGAQPPTFVAAHGESFYVSTSHGLWGHVVAERVPAGTGLAAAAAALLAAMGALLARRRPPG